VPAQAAIAKMKYQLNIIDPEIWAPPIGKELGIGSEFTMTTFGQIDIEPFELKARGPSRAKHSSV